MLLTSYLDARPGTFSTSGDRISKSRGSTTPQMGDLWRKGSYQELEEAMNELSLVSAQRLWRAFIWQPDRRRRSVQLVYRQKVVREIARDLESLSRGMPRDIHVPKDIIENWNDFVASPTRKTDQPVA